jgi:hypothetical protein
MRERRIRRSRSALSLSNGLRDLCELLFKIPGFVFHYRVNLSSQNGHIDKDLQLFVNMPWSNSTVRCSALTVECSTFELSGHPLRRPEIGVHQDILKLTDD